MENLRLLSRVALSFQDVKNFDQDMQQALEDVGSFMDISRIYIIYNETDKIMKNTFEWCNQGIIPQIDFLQEVHYEDVPSWYPTFINKGHLCSNDIMDLPEDLIAVLEPQGIKSILVYPLWINHKIKGFIGFDQCKYKRKWKKEERLIISTVSGIITNAYQRKETYKFLRESERRFSKFFSVGLDLFCIIDNQGNFIKTNKAWEDVLGYSSDQLKGRNTTDFIHPEDQKATGLFMEKLRKGQEVPNFINRYISSSGQEH